MYASGQRGQQCHCQGHSQHHGQLVRLSPVLSLCLSVFFYVSVSLYVSISVSLTQVVHTTFRPGWLQLFCHFVAWSARRTRNEEGGGVGDRIDLEVADGVSHRSTQIFSASVSFGLSLSLSLSVTHTRAHTHTLSLYLSLSLCRSFALACGGVQHGRSWRRGPIRNLLIIENILKITSRDQKMRDLCSTISDMQLFLTNTCGVSACSRALALSHLVPTISLPCLRHTHIHTYILKIHIYFHIYIYYIHTHTST